MDEERPAPVEVRDYAGEVGNRRHVTRVARGRIPTGRLAGLSGVMGERPGEHRRRAGAVWDEFVAGVRADGVRVPIFVTCDWGEAPLISEGNHRRDAAVEAGLGYVPVEIRWFGHAERHDTLLDGLDTAPAPGAGA